MISIFPDKYVPLEFSILGIAAILSANLRPNDTVSTLWDRVSKNDRIRTFERFAAGLTLLFAAGLIEADRGIIRVIPKGGILND